MRMEDHKTRLTVVSQTNPLQGSACLLSCPHRMGKSAKQQIGVIIIGHRKKWIKVKRCIRIEVKSTQLFSLFCSLSHSGATCILHWSWHRRMDLVCFWHVALPLLGPVRLSGGRRQHLQGLWTLNFAYTRLSAEKRRLHMSALPAHQVRWDENFSAM